LEFYALLYGLGEREAEERINYLLDFTGLTERQHDMYQRYSTGMARRLLLCRALLRDTPILLFDEPTVGLDPISAIEFRELLCEKLAREEDKTIFLSTHNLSEASQICDRVAIIDHGRIKTCDTVDNIRRKFSQMMTISITLQKISPEELRNVLNELREIPGVKEVVPPNPFRHIQRMLIQVDKDLNISEILKVLLAHNLMIRSISTSMPSLEEALMTVTGRRMRERGRRWIFQSGLDR